MQAWEYTPYEISLIAESKAETEKEELKKAIITAFYTEAFARHKRLPKLDKVLKNLDKPQKKTLSKGDMLLKAMAKEKGIDI